MCKCSDDMIYVCVPAAACVALYIYPKHAATLRAGLGSTWYTRARRRQTAHPILWPKFILVHACK